jgi:hypothetical protein
MESREHPWFRKRGYLHFDKPISLNSFRHSNKPQLLQLILFFLSFTLLHTYKVQKDKGTNAK